jgi:hypothetical protein
MNNRMANSETGAHKCSIQHRSLYVSVANLQPTLLVLFRKIACIVPARSTHSSFNRNQCPTMSLELPVEIVNRSARTRKPSLKRLQALIEHQEMEKQAAANVAAEESESPSAGVSSGSSSSTTALKAGRSAHGSKKTKVQRPSGEQEAPSSTTIFWPFEYYRCVVEA